MKKVVGMFFGEGEYQPSYLLEDGVVKSPHWNNIYQVYDLLDDDTYTVEVKESQVNDVVYYSVTKNDKTIKFID